MVGRGQEDDRDVPGALALLDVPGGLEAVHVRHLRVQQDHREVVDQQLLERVLAAGHRDQLDRQPLQDRLQREQVLPPVVDQRAPAASDRVSVTTPDRSASPVRRHPGGHQREQLVQVDRLGDVVAGAGGQAGLPVAGHRLGGQEDHRQVPALRLRPDPPGGLVAVQVGHHRVHQHDVDLGVLGEQPDAVGAVVGVEHRHAVQLQRAGQREDVAHVVVDDQHGGPVAAPAPGARRPARSSPGAGSGQPAAVGHSRRRRPASRPTGGSPAAEAAAAAGPRRGRPAAARRAGAA